MKIYTGVLPEASAAARGHLNSHPFSGLLIQPLLWTFLRKEELERGISLLWGKGEEVFV